MKTRFQQLEFGNFSLPQVDWLPDDPPRGAAILVHGHGDCAERHEATVKPLLDRGIACTAVDMPGHGRAPGRRGHIPGFHVVSRMLTEAKAGFESRIKQPVDGWVAHSMGGLLTIHHLAQLDSPPRYLWLSSPLIDPGAGRAWLLRFFTRCCGGVFPCIPLHTGVRRSDCRSDEQQDTSGPSITAELNHDHISLGWASVLLHLGDTLPDAIAALDPSIRVLVTQGLDDPVCPPDIGHRFFDQLPQSSKHWIELPGARHEPFADSNIGAVHQAVGTWLDEEVMPHGVIVSPALTAGS